LFRGLIKIKKIFSGRRSNYALCFHRMGILIHPIHSLLLHVIFLKKNVTIPYFRENSRFHKNSHGVTLPHTIFFTWRYHPLSTSI
ncbi:unnamed protein product, partial [Pocillopora meandrina]